ncbi:MAG TPA: double-strand break repair helicase AddA [Methyloceanibacter sp.]|nr:double-strand break repair helicase AddA [Methyloceanibacter sp.]
MSTLDAIRHTTDANQRLASDPSLSAWVSANAGTGKTEVLVRRTLRLLLAGFAPESILCLTYTKTAAAEMQNRLLEVLAGWATMPADNLNEKLVKLLGRAPEDEEPVTARRLFARALEAEGGLKIHTIHGFCERLLQRFPLESRVTPHFSVLDEREQALLRRAAFDATISRAAEDKVGMLGEALTQVIALTAGDNLRKVIDALLGTRAELAAMMAYHEGCEDWPDAECLALKHVLGVAEHLEETIVATMAGVLSDDALEAAAAALEASDIASASDRTVGTRLRQARSVEGEARTTALYPVFLTSGGKPRVRIVTQAFSREAPEIARILNVAQTEFASLNESLSHLLIAQASGAVIVLADAVIVEYERRKLAEAALDYDDLIIKAQNLLLRSNAAAWVLYKIDGGVDHILVDEAQDTNPAQWSIIESLAAEFLAGAGKSHRLRTLFAVGDEKQSIFSFQGANPARFGEVGRGFRRRAEALGLAWKEVPLTLSFRSTEPILAAVDSVFANPAAANGLRWREETAVQHHADRMGEAGLVEVWDIEEEDPTQQTDPFEPWTESVDGSKPVDRLCRRIAATIKGWIDNQEMLVSKGRPIRAGDILILVRRRAPFTTPMFRELKRQEVAVAGADRMKLLDQLAVQDLVALADVLLMPEDDLALAVVLKSPLFDFNDDDLLVLAHGRSGSLWAALKAKAAQELRFSAATAQLSHWLKRADFLPPYEFYSELLGAEGQRLRKAILTRLGPEAAEAIDEFLDVALAYDRDAAPSLQGFVNRLRHDEVEIKRDMEQKRNEVRIMTVHGAKGLQAPIVFLPDTCAGPRPQNPRIFSVPRAAEPPDTVGHLLWPPKGHSGATGIAHAKDAADDADQQEYHRLLYVAMTRARDRLYVCGWKGRQGLDKSWYDLITTGLDGCLSKTAGPDGKPVRRMENDQTKDVPPADAEPVAAASPPLPAWALQAAAPGRSRPKLAPSRLALGEAGGVEALPPEQVSLGPLPLSQNNRFARGRLVHALLQHLPELDPEAQERAARAFIAAHGAELTQELKDEILAETLAVVRDSAFAPLFQPGSIAEVPIVAHIGGYDLEGQIDRLVEVGNALLILDYKTNRPPPKTLEEVAPAYIAQLAAYRAALRNLYPNRTLRAALLWTDGARLMEVPSADLDAAERRLLEHPAKP